MPQQPQTEIDSIIQKARPTNRDLVRRDISQAMQLPITHLILKSTEYFYNDGTSKELLCLCGTVACDYRGSRYNIPVEVWLQQDHPHVAPVGYVKPTSGMYVSTSSQDVKPDGLIVLQYLRTWRHPTSDLSSLFRNMSDSFGRNPPVYSAASQSTTPYPVNPSNSMPMPLVNPNSFTGSLNPHPYPITTTTQIPHDIYRDSLQTALLQKVRDRLNEQTLVGRGKIDSLKKTEQDLINGDKQLQTYIDNIQQQLVQGQAYMRTMQDKIEQLNEANQKMSSSVKTSDEGNIREDALATLAPVHKQLFQCYAEEHAIQDLLFYLSEGLERRSITFDVYLKHVRELSRRQFLLRATMRKCRQIAGLAVK